MRREELYLRDIVEAADHIARFVAESGLSGFRESEMVRSAIVQSYTLSFWAMSSSPRNMLVALLKAGGSYPGYGLSTHASLGSTVGSN
jgi:hypothetical protein